MKHGIQAPVLFQGFGYIFVDCKSILISNNSSICRYQVFCWFDGEKDCRTQCGRQAVSWKERSKLRGCLVNWLYFTLVLVEHKNVICPNRYAFLKDYTVESADDLKQAG